MCVKFERILLNRFKDMTRRKSISTSSDLAIATTRSPLALRIIRRAVTAALLLLLSRFLTRFLKFSSKICAHNISKSIHPIIMKFHRLIQHDQE